MNIEGKTGPQTLGDGAWAQPRLSRDGSVVTQDSHGKYQEAVYRNNVFMLSVANATATAYTGGAAGTPLLAVHNPTNSGKNLVLLSASIANRTAASAAGTVNAALYGGVSAQPSGTQTNPRSMLSLQQSGSVMLGFSNTALTGSTGLNLLMSLWNYYWATAAGAIMGDSLFDIAGQIIIVPGNEIAFGASAALTSATFDVSLIWEEVPI